METRRPKGKLTVWEEGRATVGGGDDTRLWGTWAGVVSDLARSLWA